MSKIYYGDENNTAVELNIGVSQEYVDGQIEAVSADIHSIPDGGTAGQVLSKVDSTNYNTQWIDPPSGLPAGGTTGQVLTKKSSSDYDVEWNNSIPIVAQTADMFNVYQFSKPDMSRLYCISFKFDNLEIPVEGVTLTETITDPPLTTGVGTYGIISTDEYIISVTIYIISGEIRLKVFNATDTVNLSGRFIVWFRE